MRNAQVDRRGIGGQRLGVQSSRHTPYAVRCVGFDVNLGELWDENATIGGPITFMVCRSGRQTGVSDGIRRMPATFGLTNPYCVEERAEGMVWKRGRCGFHARGV